MEKTKDLTSFIPLTKEEMKARNWDAIDILLVTGDAYVDHPSFCGALIGRVLLNAGYRVAMVAQPDWKDPNSLKTFGTPRIGCAITSGNMDSMLCIYTAGRRMRHEDMFSPGGKTGMKPPHASVVYTQLCKAAFPGVPTVLGGSEVSLRRVAHYDYWQDKMRPSFVVDSKADIVIYGMGERATLEIFARLKEGKPLDGIPGTARYLGGKASKELVVDDSYIELPTYDEIVNDKQAIMRETIIVEREMNPWNGKRLLQKYGDRWLLIEPPMPPLSQKEMDEVYELPYVGVPHWSYTEKIPAFETIKDSIPVVRGCPGGCAFCGLVSHQNHHLVSRSEESILRSIRKLTEQKFFHGTISDLNGAAGNIYGHGPKNPELCKKCHRITCMFPSPCPNYNADESKLISLLNKVKAIPGVKNIFINSGIRLDLALMQPKLTEQIIRENVSGHVKVAPEHLHPRVLELMRKGKPDEFPRFKKIFDRVCKECGKEQYLIPLFISNFPGCTDEEMKVVDDFLAQFNWSPQQVQDYIPLPMTMGAAMYCSGTDAQGNPIHVNRGLAERRPQRNMLRRKRDGEGDTLATQRGEKRGGKSWGHRNGPNPRNGQYFRGKSDGNSKHPSANSHTDTSTKRKGWK